MMVALKKAGSLFLESSLLHWRKADEDQMAAP